MSIAHFILTRSAYQLGRPAQLWTPAIIDERYLQYRLGLLRQFCAASLAAQTRQEFSWVVRVDASCPLLDERRQVFESLPMPVLPIVAGATSADASDTASTGDRTWREVIDRHLPEGTTHVLTTRLDDDDALAPDFVARLRRAVEPTPAPVVYTFPVGYSLGLHSQGSRYSRWRKVNNQFVSLLSPIRPLTLVVDRKHGDVGQLGPWKVVDEDPAHLWVRHPRTKSRGGRFRSQWPVARLVREWPFLAGVV